MEKVLPKNWVETTVGEIANLVTGNTPKKSVLGNYGGNIPFYKPADLDQGYHIDQTKDTLTEKGFAKSRELPKNSTLVTCIGATIGKTGFIRKKGASNQQINSILPNDSTIPEFVYFQCISSEFKKTLIENSSSTTLPIINKTRFSKLPFLLPPLAEQKRIVAKLDGLFGHLDRLKERLSGIPRLLASFRQSVLTQAVTGKLTEEWRVGKKLENNFENKGNYSMREVNLKLPRHWKWLPFSAIATVKSNLVQPNDYYDLPLIAPNNIQSKKGKLISKPLVSEIKPKSAKHLFPKGCIIYSKIRPYLSKLVVVDFKGLCSADMYPILSELEMKYLFYYLLSEEFLSYANTSGERTVLPKINQKELNIIPVSVPPQSEQKEIVSQVEYLFSKADAIETRYEALKEKIDYLPQAILTKAFSGELVQQLDTDGDARDLLEEIKQMREKLDSKKRKRSENEDKTTLGF